MFKKLTWLTFLVLALSMTAGLAYGQSVNINFQKLGGDEPNDYLPDFGEVFADRGNGFSYGWDADVMGAARDRDQDRAPDQRYDTLIHFSKNGDATWEIELVDGEYDLFIVCGDSNHTDQTNTLNVEGTIVVDADGESAEDYWDEYALTVDVIDGRLTIIPAEGSSNAKIAFIDIMQVGPPRQATQPSPTEGTADLLRDEVALGWTAGAYAELHNLYLGTSLEDVAAADIDANNVAESVVAMTLDAAGYVPSGLEFGTVYYWRVDEVSTDPNIATAAGAVWSFTVESSLIPVENIVATASSAYSDALSLERTIDGSGLDENDLHSANGRDMWLSDALGSPASATYEFDSTYKIDQMWVWNSNTGIEPVYGYGPNDVTIEYSMDGVNWMVFSDVQLAEAPGLDGSAPQVVDLGIGAKAIRLTLNTNHGGDLRYGLAEVRFYYVPVKAREPQPADGTVDVAVNDTLSWRSGLFTNVSDVQLSSSMDAVAGNTALADAIVGNSLDLDPLGLNIGTTYYWKVNEVNDALTPNFLDGDIWSFTTQDYFVVDDFDGYDGNLGGTWKDGWKLNTGVQTGSSGTSAIDAMVANSGTQSMVLTYDNSKSPYIVEVERAVSSRQNWTNNGVKKLVLFFHGDPGNSSRDKLYVKINGKKVTYGGSLTSPWWKSWSVDVASLGINIRSIAEIAVGVGDTPLPAGGKGKVYIDDIRLYRSAPSVPTLVEAAIALNNSGEFAGQFDTMLAAIMAADSAIVEELSSEGAYTVFAPTDDAFAAFGIDAGNVASLDAATLNDILLYHVADGKLMADDVLAAGQIEMIAGGSLAQADGMLTDNVGQQAAIIAADGEAANGVIHVIDTMVLPYEIRNVVEMMITANSTGAVAGQLNELIAIVQNNPALLGLLTNDDAFTVFAPTDAAIAALAVEADDNLFLYHLTPGSLLAADVLAADQLVMLNGGVVMQADGILTDVAGQQVAIIVTDIIGTNGVIHVIDTVLVPTALPVENLLANGGFEDGVTDPWSVYGDTTMEVVSEGAVEGTSCLHVTVNSAGANFWDAGLQHTGHVFEAGKQYTLSAFLRAGEGTMDINFKPELAADPWSGFGDQVFTMTDEWVEYSVTTPVLDGDVDPAAITFHIAFTAGDFYIDDVKFYEGEYVPTE